VTLPLPRERADLRKFMIRVSGHRCTGYYAKAEDRMFTWSDGRWVILPASDFDTAPDCLRAYWEGRRLCLT